MSRTSKQRRRARIQRLKTRQAHTLDKPVVPVSPPAPAYSATTPVCYHSTPTHVFDIGHSQIWAGIESCIPEFTEPALVVDCSNVFGASHLLVPPGFESLTRYAIQLPILQIPWPDGSLPEVQPEFWQELVKLLPAGNVYVCCIGGHGRTGTALAALRLLSLPATTVREAILEIRKMYCPEAIESTQQIEYLYDLGRLIGGLDMVNDSDQPRPRGAWQPLTVSPKVYQASPSLRGWASVGPDDAETDESVADPCADSLDADMLEHWPLSRTMTEAEIAFYRDSGTWPTAVWEEYDAQANASAESKT